MAVQGLLKKLILMFTMSSAIKIWLFPKLDMLKKITAVSNKSLMLLFRIYSS